MRLKCIRRTTIESTVLDFAAHTRPDRNEYDLVIGQEYVAMGLGFWDSQVWAEIATDGGFLMSVPLQEFEIACGTPSAFWVTRMDPDGTVRLWPPSFFEEGYQALLADREPRAVADFDRIRELIEAEDQRRMMRIDD